MKMVSKFFRKAYNLFTSSIGFLPAVLGLGFLGLALIGIELDNRGIGEALNEKVEWLRLKDAETARTIIGTVAGGMISLTVFTFSMVMLVMNQAASQMSNRVLDNILGDRVQQAVLGLYIGTIVYAFVLLTTIGEASKTSSVPVFSIYMLLFFAVMDMFLFIYFLHYITQSIRFEQLIERIRKRAWKALNRISTKPIDPSINEFPHKQELPSLETGYFQGFTLKKLKKLATDNNLVIEFLYAEGSYLLRGVAFLRVCSQNKLEEKLIKEIHADIDFYYKQEIRRNTYYGFQHLTEVGVKALSPGINDPGTAVMSLNAIADLLMYRMNNVIPNIFNDDAGTTRIITKELSFEELFETSVLPIWDYGKDDRLIQAAMIRLINQLMELDKEGKQQHLFNRMIEDVQLSQSS